MTSRDRGSASICLLALGLVLVIAAAAGASVGAARVARQQAQVAADLSALAGAARAVEGSVAACARAAEFAEANQATLVECELTGFDLTVTVRVSPPSVVGVGRPATGMARAGPVQADDSQTG